MDLYFLFKPKVYSNLEINDTRNIKGAHHLPDALQEIGLLRTSSHVGISGKGFDTLAVFEVPEQTLLLIFERSKRFLTLKIDLENQIWTFV